jgi:hypothetical protein
MSSSGTLHHRVLWLLVLTLSGPMVTGCRDQANAPVRVSLAELVEEQNGYQGRRVQTAGVVRRFDEAGGATKLHYVIEDEHANRVAILPNDIAERHTGQRVLVVGAFRFSEGRGREIEIERIERLETERPAG